MKYTINLNWNLKDIGTDESGQPTMVETDQRASKVVAQMLRASTTGDSLKTYDWMVAFHQLGVVDLDESDASALRKIIFESTAILNMGKAQIVRSIDSARLEQQVAMSAKPATPV